MAISDEELPPDQRGLRSMQPGIYRIEIKHPHLKQPTTPLGCEIDPTFAVALRSCCDFDAL